MSKKSSKEIEKLIFDELCRRKLLESEIRIIEQQIDHFLHEYCSDLQEIFTDIDHAEFLLQKHSNEIRATQSKEKQKTRKNDNITQFSKDFFKSPEGNFIKTQLDQQDKNDAFMSELSSIYRKLVKLCHPDSNNTNDPDAREVFDMVQSAYQAKDIKSLIMFEKILEDADDKEKQEAQDNSAKKQNKEFYLNLKEENKNYASQKEALISSPCFNLERRIRWAKMCGEDPIQTIKEDALNDRNSKINQLEKLGICWENQKNDCA